MSTLPIATEFFMKVDPTQMFQKKSVNDKLNDKSALDDELDEYDQDGPIDFGFDDDDFDDFDAGSDADSGDCGGDSGDTD